MNQRRIPAGVAETGTLVAAVVLAAGLVWYVQQDGRAPPAEAVAEAAAPASLSAAGVADATPDTGPQFDTVRISPEGEAVVAGRAAPGAEVVLQLDGSEAARVTASPSGEFVAMFTLPPSATPRLLGLTELPPGASADTAPRVAVQTVAIAPVQAPDTAPGMPDDIATVTATEPPATLLLSEDGARLLQGAQVAPGGVSIATITYTLDGGVQLSGLGQAGAGVQLYLDNLPVARSAVGANGIWAATLHRIAPGLYTLRADQIGADDKVIARFETPFRRETPEALAAVLKPRASAGVAVATTAVGQAAAPAPSLPLVPASAAPAGTVAAGGSTLPVSVTVQPGFTLWRIARETFGDGVMYVKVFEANRDQIRDPDLIYPGQVFALPR